MKKLALIFVATASLAGTAMACPGHDAAAGKTAQTSETKPQPKAEQPKEAAKATESNDSKDAPKADTTKKADKVSSK